MRRTLKTLALCFPLTTMLVGAGPAAGKDRASPSSDAQLKEGLSALGSVPKSCTFKGKKLWGKVQIVDSFPDIKVQVVDSFPDLKVQKVTSFPDTCGKWKFVTSFPDFKIKLVNSFPDIKIKYVTSFPGVP